MNLLAISLAPVLIIAIYVYFRDKYEKEPFRLLLSSLLAGAFIVIPVIFTEKYLIKFMPKNNIYSEAFYHAFVVAACTEEIFKFLALYYLIWRNKEFNERFDGIVYGVFVSLGFAAIENIMYVYDGGMSTGLIRAFTAVPAHAIFGITMGYYFGLAKFSKNNRFFYLLSALIMPIVLHGIYDFILFSKQPVFMLFFIPFCIFLYINGLKKMKKLNFEL